MGGENLKMTSFPLTLTEKTLEHPLWLLQGKSRAAGDLSPQGTHFKGGFTFLYFWLLLSLAFLSLSLMTGAISILQVLTSTSLSCYLNKGPIRVPETWPRSPVLDAMHLNCLCHITEGNVVFVFVS